MSKPKRTTTKPADTLAQKAVVGLLRELGGDALGPAIPPATGLRVYTRETCPKCGAVTWTASGSPAVYSMGPADAKALLHAAEGMGLGLPDGAESGPCDCAGATVEVADPETAGTAILTPAPKHANREAWLAAAILALSPIFDEAGAKLPERMRAACSWPRGKRSAIGQAWTAKASGDGTVEVMVSPVTETPRDVLAILVHELIHAAQDAAGEEMTHKGGFPRHMAPLGLTGKPRATLPDPATFDRIYGATLEALGPYPHAALSPTEGIKKQATRMLKCKCGACGYTCRTTRQWLEAYGTPLCPCQPDEPQRMEADGFEPGDKDGDEDEGLDE